MIPKDCDPVITVRGLRNSFGEAVIHDGIEYDPSKLLHP